MTKLCPRGKAAAKESLMFIHQLMQMHMHLKSVQVKLKDPSGVKRKDFRGRIKAKGGLWKQQLD